MRTQRHWSLAAVAAVAMLASLAGVPLAAGRPDGEAEVLAADPADNAVDVEGTVAEVQRRLREDPRLPRLTPDQIRGLIREVAANDSRLHLADEEDVTATSNSSERGDRSLVLVMSHSAANMSGERLQSLYTQPPVTRVVPDHLLQHHQQQQPGAHDHQQQPGAHHHQQQPGTHDHQQHHDQAPAPPRPAEDAERATPGPARTPPPTAVPPNHRPSYDDPEPHWRQRQPSATQTERPLLFNFFEDEDFLASTRAPLEPTTGHQTSVTTNTQLEERTTQYAEVTEDTTGHSRATEYTTDDIERPVTNKPLSKPSRLSGYKNQQRYSPPRGSTRRKKPVQPSGTPHSFSTTTDQTNIDQTPSESAFSYSETSTSSPTTTESWNENVKGPSNIREDVATQTGRPTDPENFEITVGTYNTKPRITLDNSNPDAESGDIIYNEDWRPPLAVRPDDAEAATEVHSGHDRQAQTTTSRVSSNTQRPLQNVDTQPFYVRKKPSYITSESIRTAGDHPEGDSAFITNDGAVSQQGGGDPRPPARHPETPPAQASGRPSSTAVHRGPPAPALVDSGGWSPALELSAQTHQADGPLDNGAALTPSPGPVQRRPGIKRRRPIHRRKPVPHDSANVVATVETSYVQDSAATGGSVQPFRPLDPGLLASLSLSPRPPTTAAPTTTTTTTTTTTATHAESPDVSAAAAALSPAVRDLLQSLGLLDPVLPQPPAPPRAALAPAGPPPPDPAPFRAFKPLPQSRAEPQEQDMRSLLHRFGLLDPAPPTRGRRRQKTLAGAPPSDANETTGDGSTTTTSTTPLTLDAIDTSMLTDEMRAVLHNLGIVPAPTADAAPTTTRAPVHESATGGGAGDTDVDDATGKQGPEHVFSPTSLKHSEEETARLQAVLDSVRQFAATHLNATPATNGSGPAQSTTARADRALEAATTMATPLAVGPDPVSFEELLAGLQTEESRKNEVKRQQPSDANTTATTGSPEREVEEVTSRANRTAEDEARVQALSESFGGLDDSGDADYEEQEGGEQAVQRPNGLYFLVDWNSFLRVGEEDKPRVNLRFSPRAGNPRNFLPVTVP